MQIQPYFVSRKKFGFPALHVSSQYGVSLRYILSCKTIKPLQGATLHFLPKLPADEGPYGIDSRIKVSSRYGALRNGFEYKSILPKWGPTLQIRVFGYISCNPDIATWRAAAINCCVERDWSAKWSLIQLFGGASSVLAARARKQSSKWLACTNNKV
jgi:hypothetical protein